MALAIHIEIEAVDGTQIIEAMIGFWRFCHELLASEISEDYPVEGFDFLHQYHGPVRFRRFPATQIHTPLSSTFIRRLLFYFVFYFLYVKYNINNA